MQYNLVLSVVNGECIAECTISIKAFRLVNGIIRSSCNCGGS